MSLPKIAEARNLNDQDLAEEILAAKKKLFDLRFQQATRQLEKTHEFKHTRHRIAQLFTVERERQLGKNNSESTPFKEE
jgi:large subunit ribosomal protein L29